MKKAGEAVGGRADGSVGVSDDVLAFRRRERAKRDFDEPYWPVGRTIRWIVECERARVALEKLGADIDPDVGIQSLTPTPDEPKAAHAWTELAHRTSAFAAKYDFWRGPENEQQLAAARLLLKAIQVGRIQPIDENGGIMPREKWAHATPGDWPDVRMLRDEILREFPAKPLSAFPANVAVEKISGRPESEEASGSGDAESADPPMKAVSEITTDARPSSGRRTASVSPSVERALRELYPEEPPVPNREAIRKAVEDKIGHKVSSATLDRARKKVWSTP
jgi:hypothetical protein